MRDAAKTHESSVSTTDKDKKALGRIFNLMNSRIITIREDIERTENRLANLRRMEKAALEEARAYRELYDRV